MPLTRSLRVMDGKCVCLMFVCPRYDVKLSLVHVFVFLVYVSFLFITTFHFTVTCDLQLTLLLAPLTTPVSYTHLTLPTICSV